MHSSLVRAQNVFGFFTTVAFAVGALIAFSDIISPRTPSASVSVKNLQVVRGRPHYYSTKKEEYAHIKFNLDADLSSLFTWNTKQVFVWVSAAWPNQNATAIENGAGMNEAIIWDTIITSPSADHLANLSPSAMKKVLKERKEKGTAVDPSRGIISLKNQKPKYQITSIDGKLAETEDVTLHVHYNVQPWVGILTWKPEIELGYWKLMKGGVSKAFALPPLKKKEEKKL